MTTEDVCRNFFDFSGELNKGYDIIAAMYSWIVRCKKQDLTYFMFLDRQIMRFSNQCYDKKDFIRLLRIALTNVCFDKSPRDINWKIIAHMFYVSEKVDDIAAKLWKAHLQHKFNGERKENYPQR